MDNSSSNTITDSIREHYAALSFIGYLSYLEESAKSGEEYCGSEEAECLMNESARFTSQAMQYDICEKDSWSEFTSRATTEEICKFCVMKLKQELLSDQTDHIYAVKECENKICVLVSRRGIESMFALYELKESIFALDVNKGIGNHKTFPSIFRIR